MSLSRKTPMKPGRGFKSRSPERPAYDADRVRTTPTPTAAFRLPTRADTHAEPILKDEPVRSEAYRRLVAALPCIFCGLHGYSQAAHPPPKGKGIKESDDECFPLCCTRPGEIGCHVRLDQRMLLTKEETRPTVEVWARNTREAIIDAGLWPKGLPKWEEKNS